MTSLTRTIVVAQILGVLILAELVVSEDVAPWRSVASDLSLEAAQIGEVSDIGVGEGKVAVNVAIDTLGNSRQVQIIPGCEVIATTVVVVCGTRVRRSQRVCDGCRDIGLEHIDITVGGVRSQVSSSKESCKFHQAKHWERQQA